LHGKEERGRPEKKRAPRTIEEKKKGRPSSFPKKKKWGGGKKDPFQEKKGAHLDQKEGGESEGVGGKSLKERGGRKPKSPKKKKERSREKCCSKKGKTAFCSS